MNKTLNDERRINDPQAIPAPKMRLRTDFLKLWCIWGGGAGVPRGPDQPSFSRGLARVCKWRRRCRSMITM